MDDVLPLLLLVFAGIVLLRLIIRILRGFWPGFWSGLWSALFLRWLVVPSLARGRAAPTGRAMILLVIILVLLFLVAAGVIITRC